MASQVPAVPGSVTNGVGNGDRGTQPKYEECLYRAALRDDWQAAEEVHRKHPDCFKKSISKYGDTALHIAAASGHYRFVEQLLGHGYVTVDQLSSTNNQGDTVFCLAVASGDIQMIKMLENLSPELRDTPGSQNMRPLLMAALIGHGEIVKHLLKSCFDSLSEEERIDLLINTINAKLYDVALKIINKDGSLAFKRNGDNKTPLHVLARMTHSMSRFTWSKAWRQFLNALLFQVRNNQCDQCEDSVKLQLVENLWAKVIEQDLDTISDVLSRPQPPLLFRAIEVGNYDFFVILVRHYPDLIWEVDTEDRTIFHVAVQYRQEKIFSHIHQIRGINHLLTGYKNPNNGNNILHLAATLPPSDRLNVVPGPALQLQRELLWFQAVEEVVQRGYFDMENSPPLTNEGLRSGPKETPRALFSREHTSLREEGEKWMRATAKSYMLVATLIAGAVFQATFQSPSNKNHIMYSVFIILDTISLLASTASILTFLAILTSRCAEEDFLTSLPLKLMVGLVLLFLAIITMLIAFTISIAIIFPHKFVWITVLILALFTSGFYPSQHIVLLLDVYHSTFGYDHLFRPQQELFRD